MSLNQYPEWVKYNELNVVQSQEIIALKDRIKRLEEALSQIANQDYRGNRSTESQIAFEALKGAKL